VKMPESLRVALGCVAVMNGNKRCGRRIGWPTLIARNWGITPKRVKAIGAAIVLRTPDDARRVRFGWRHEWTDPLQMDPVELADVLPPKKPVRRVTIQAMMELSERVGRRA
jgi:hypothetical protein